MRLPLLLPAVLTGFLLSGCGRAPEPQQHGLKQIALKSVSLPRDDLGREIKLGATPRRIVTIGPGATEIVFGLGAGNRLVGRDSGSDYPPDKVKAVPVVANFAGPFFEKTAAVRPDLIIAQGETYDKARADLWQQKCGAPVAVLAATSVAQVVEGIDKIATWLGAGMGPFVDPVHRTPRPNSPALALGSAHKRADSLRQLRKKSANDTSAFNDTSVFFEVQRSPLWTAGRGTLINDVLNVADKKNVADDIDGYKAYSLESLLLKNPDYYVVAAQKPDRERTLRELRQHPVLRNLRCVRRGDIIVVPADLVLRPGPRLGDGIAALSGYGKPGMISTTRLMRQQMRRQTNSKNPGR